MGMGACCEAAARSHDPAGRWCRFCGQPMQDEGRHALGHFFALTASEWVFYDALVRQSMDAVVAAMSARAVAYEVLVRAGVGVGNLPEIRFVEDADVPDVSQRAVVVPVRMLVEAASTAGCSKLVEDGWVLVRWLCDVDCSLWVSLHGLSLRGDVALSVPWRGYWGVWEMMHDSPDREILVGALAMFSADWVRGFLRHSYGAWIPRRSVLERAWQAVERMRSGLVLKLSEAVRGLCEQSDLLVVAGL